MIDYEIWGLEAPDECSAKESAKNVLRGQVKGDRNKLLTPIRIRLVRQEKNGRFKAIAYASAIPWRKK